MTEHSYPNRRAAITAAMVAISQYERELCEDLVQGLLQIPNIKIYGITDASRFDWRTPTVAPHLNPYKTGQAMDLSPRGKFCEHLKPLSVIPKER